ncbi:MAG: preprotein translocase subunit YajC [Deltaproteobacteria bacterium]|jgi:preprotein translocase subunit YajC|nr:preprotein translocase subunit YajC [Deltaproteobacteria bacterium]
MFEHISSAAAALYAAAPAAQNADGTTQPAGGGGAQLIIFIVGFIVIFYFLMLRPQKKQQKERQNMLDNVRKGDRIQTSGGLIGIITATDAREITLRIAPDVRVKIARSAIAGVIKNIPEETTDLSKDAPEEEKESNPKNEVDEKRKD